VRLPVLAARRLEILGRSGGGSRTRLGEAQLQAEP